MNCWHCDEPIKFESQNEDLTVKIYTCKDCNAWYEMRKEKTKLNAAVPIRMTEIEAPHSALYRAA